MTETVQTRAPVVRVVPQVQEEDGKASSLVLIAHKIGDTHSFFNGCVPFFCFAVEVPLL